MWSARGDGVIFSSSRGNRWAPLPYRFLRCQRTPPHVVGAGGLFACDESADGRVLVLQRTAPRPGGTCGWRIPTSCNRSRASCRRQPTIATRSSREMGSGSRTNPTRRAGTKSSCGRCRPRNTRAGSAGGGSQVRWRTDGRELFYVGTDGMLMVATVTPGEGAKAPELARPCRSSPHRSAPCRLAAGAQYVVSKMAGPFWSTSSVTTSGRRPFAGS